MLDKKELHYFFINSRGYMKKITLFAGCLLVLCHPPLIMAEQGSITTGAKIGTLGVGGEMHVGWNEYIHLRSGVNFLNFSFDSTISNIDYEMEPEFKNGSVVLDWYPFGGAFRLSGGLFINDNTITLTGKPRSDSEYWALIPEEYNSLVPLVSSTRIHGSVDFNTLSPYIGIGWNSNTKKTKGWGVAFELGVLYQGAPEVSPLTASANEPLNVLASHPTVTYYLESERQQIEDDLEDFEYYPVATLTLSYTF